MRNHSAEDAFDKCPNLWLSGFYGICNSLAGVLGESLESLFGTEQARIAHEILKETRDEATSRVQATLAAHRRVFASKSPVEQQKQQTAAAETGGDVDESVE